MMSEASSRTALGQLIADVQAANRWSYADISANAVAAGRKLSRSRVESLRNDPLPSISTKAIEALAAGLKVSPQQVAQAAMKSLGYDVADSGGTLAEALAADAALSEPMRRVLLAALDAARAESGSDHAAGSRRARLRDANEVQSHAADSGDG